MLIDKELLDSLSNISKEEVKLYCVGIFEYLDKYTNKNDLSGEEKAVITWTKECVRQIEKGLVQLWNMRKEDKNEVV